MDISVESIRKSLRISHNALDDEIRGNLSACLLDLERVGVDRDNVSELTRKACDSYCKWQCDFQGKGEQYRKNYESLRDSMALCKLYRGDKTDV